MKKTLEQKRTIASYEKLATNEKTSQILREFAIKQLKALNASKLRISRAEQAKTIKTGIIKSSPIEYSYQEEEFNCEAQMDMVIDY